MEPSKVQKNYRFLRLVQKLVMINPHKLLHQAWTMFLSWGYLAHFATIETVQLKLVVAVAHTCEPTRLVVGGCRLNPPSLPSCAHRTSSAHLPPDLGTRYNPPLPTTIRFNPLESHSTHQRLLEASNGKLQLAKFCTQWSPALSHRKMFWEVFFIYVFIQIHTNVGEETQHQMSHATVLILEVRDQKDEQLLSEN